MLHGRVFTQSPPITYDGNAAPLRLNKFGELVMETRQSGLHGICDEGNAYKAMTAIGTAINVSGAAQTAYVATTPTVILRNSSASATGPAIYPLHLRMVWVTAPTGATSVQGLIVTDSGGVRYSSGGSALSNYNSLQGSSNSPIGVCHAGAITAGAATGAVREVFRFALKGAIPAVGDCTHIRFGEQSMPGNQALTAAVGPVVIPANITGQVMIYLWFPGQSGTGTAEFEMAWMER